MNVDRDIFVLTPECTLSKLLFLDLLNKDLVGLLCNSTQVSKRDRVSVYKIPGEGL